MSEAGHEPEVANVEAALLGLTPRSSGLDRDRLMFRAGQAARPQRSRLWPCTSAALALSTATLAVLLAMRSPAPTVERVVVVYRPASPLPEQQVPAPTPGPTPAPAVAPGSAAQALDGVQAAARMKESLPELGGLLKLRGEVLRWGVDALPPSSPVAYSDPSPRKDATGMSLDNLDRPGAWHSQLQ